jgi:hypothetical protein
MNMEIERAVSAGVVYLTSRQQPDGHWEEWDDIPPGAAQAFITAYTGMSLIDVEISHPSIPTAQYVARAADWLIREHPVHPGWGWNKKLQSDADSTGHALLLLRTLGRKIQERDLRWLIRLWQPGGGFPSYNPKGKVAGRPVTGWGAPHPDVTPLAFSALPEHEQQRKRWSFSWKRGLSCRSIRQDFMNYALRIRRPDGSWPNYWWRTCYYSTFWTLETLRKLGWNEPVGPPAISPQENQTIHSAFDLALVLGISLFGSDQGMREKYAADLLKLQLKDGSWMESTNLRIVRTDCYPGQPVKGQLYIDTQKVLTTATAVRMLARLARQIKNGS